MYRLDKNGSYQFKWLDKVKELLTKCKFSNLYIQQEQYTTKIHLKKTIFSTLDDIEKQNWYEQLFKNSCCHTYRCFKENLQFEKYLTELTFREKIMLTKFRCNNNRLPVNKNRFIGDDIDKLCPLCNSGDRGDEFHYLFLCDNFNLERGIYLKKYYFEKPNTLKMKHLFSNTNKNILKNLVKFISVIMANF